MARSKARSDRARLTRSTLFSRGSGLAGFRGFSVWPPAIAVRAVVVLLGVVVTLPGCAAPARPGPDVAPSPTDAVATQGQTPSPLTDDAIAGESVSGLRTDTTSQFRGGPGRSGVYRGAPFRALGEAAWVTCTGGTVRSSAAVIGGTVFIGSGDGRLRAIDGSSGTTLWSYEAGSPISSSPAVWGDAVIAVDRAGVIHAVRAADGQGLWRRGTGPDLPMPWGSEGWDYFTGSPLVMGETLVVAGGDGVVRWLDATGRVLREADLGTRLRSTPAFAAGRIYVGGADGVVYALDPGTGEVLWRQATEGAGLRSAEFGYDRRTVQSTPVFADGTVFVGARDGHLYALDARTGERRWRASYEPSWVVSSPAVQDGVVYTGTSDGLLVQALDAATGEERWTTRVGTRVLGSPTLVGDVLLVPGNDGRLRALDAEAGDELWSYRAGGMIQSSPVVDGDLVFFGDDAGMIHALRAGETTPRLAVFHDSATAHLSTMPGGERLRDDLAGADYAVLDAGGLAAFLEDRIRDGAPSAVVAAQDYLPPAVGSPGPDGEPPLFRRYLESGGKVVWLGMPPDALVRDSAGRPTAFDLDRTRRLVGAPFEAPVGEHGALPTPDGRRWGLERVRLASHAAVADSVDVVLALDPLGRAGAFATGAGAPEGRGFVFLWGRGYATGMLPAVRRATEAGVLRDRVGAEPAVEVPIRRCPAAVR